MKVCIDGGSASVGPVSRGGSIGRMTIAIENVGIAVRDIDAAIASSSISG